MSVDYICHSCVDDIYLSAEIEESGAVQTCICCSGNTENCWTASELSERIKVAFDDNYSLTASEPEMWEQALMRDRESDYDWDRDGAPIAAIVEELTGLPEDICEILIEPWSGGPHWDHHNPGEEDPYGADAHYELSQSRTEAIESRWREIQHELLHRSRFFSSATRDFLDDLFCEVQGLRTFMDPVVNVLEPHSFDGLYRGRVAYDKSGLKKILEGVPNELAALRGRSVSAGRMNAAGVTVMYGAYEPETCIAEVRAPVGSKVVIGKFKLLRPIRVLNLKTLERCYEPPSIFDPEYQKKVDRFAFLRSLSGRLSAPVFSHNAHFDYLATQCIAEYIAAMDPKIDGVAFASSQAGGNAMNLVLFDDACHVAPLAPTLGKANFYDYRPSDFDELSGPNLIFDQPTVQTSPDEQENQGDDAVENEVLIRFANALPKPRPECLPTLELDLESITIHEVKGVVYDAPGISLQVSHT
ncbi:RES family NAD+ phosphorylase [Comamonas thiooxydans]|uniref:RES family NAD+ phosphorylase n=1 Tax=Comamonas thiooxydans TaxID=363952 RepID=UPI0009EE5B91|nr:RES family NAD+ phosphorylase [Comamonas thiooxydans]